METLMNAKAALLAALISGAGFGLELIERVNQRSGGAMKLNQGAVYPALRSLEREGLVRSYDGEENVAERGGRPRRYYELTGEGRRVAREQKRAILGLLRPAGETA